MVDAVRDPMEHGLSPNLEPQSRREEGGPPLGLVRMLCDALEEAGVKYCHFKSNIDLHLSAAGVNDLDLLVSGRSSLRFAHVLSELGFRVAHVPQSYRVPGVEHVYGMDAETGSLVHIHAHYDLVVGDDTTKNYRLPIEDAYLASCTRRELFRVPAPEFEFVLFVVRMVLKHGPWDVALGPRGSLSARERRELEHLKHAADPEHIRELLTSSVSLLGAEMFEQCVRSLSEGASAALRARVTYELQRSLASYARRPQLVDSALKLWRRRSRRARRRLVGSRRKVLDRGRVIAIVGGDGAGKTSAVKELHSWLCGPFLASRVHLGKPPRSATTVAIRAALRSGRVMGIVRTPPDEPLPSGLWESESPGFASLLPHVLLARDRYRLSIRARRIAAKGGIVVSDRFPLTQIRSMDGARTSELRTPGLSRLGRWLVRREQRYYELIGLPDLTIVLRVEPEVAVRRKVDDEPRAVRLRNSEIWNARWDEPTTHVIDASQAPDGVLLEMKSWIWSGL